IFIFIVSPFVAKFYEKPILEPLIKVYCFGFVLIALRMVHQVILTKNLQFKEITLLNIPGNLVGLILSLSMALRGFGVWSLI
ncbi:oligosaccharide flippase family protein, partial [Acinetobacter baumannii]